MFTKCSDHMRSPLPRVAQLVEVLTLLGVKTDGHKVTRSLKRAYFSKTPQLDEVLTLLGVKTDGHSGLIDFVNNIGPLPTLFNNSQHFSLLTRGLPEASRGAIPPK